MQLGAGPCQRLAYQVELADRDARRRQDHVGVAGAAHALLDRLQAIGRDPEAHRIAARLEHLGHERVRVRVGNLSGTGLGAEVGELVARRQDRDARPPVDRHLAVAERGEQPDLGGGQERARLEHPIAGAHVLAGRSHVCRRLDGPSQRHVTIGRVDVLLRDDGVRPARQRRAREDPHRLAASHRPRRQRPRLHAPHDGQRRALAGIRRSHRIPIHRRIRPRRNDPTRHDGLGQRAPQRRHHVDVLRLQCRHTRENRLERLFDTQHMALLYTVRVGVRRTQAVGGMWRGHPETRLPPRSARAAFWSSPARPTPHASWSKMPPPRPARRRRAAAHPSPSACVSAPYVEG